MSKTFIKTDISASGADCDFCTQLAVVELELANNPGPITIIYLCESHKTELVDTLQEESL